MTVCGVVFRPPSPLIATALLTLSACATVPRDAALELARAGVEVTGAVQEQAELTRLQRASTQSLRVFSNTLLDCETRTASRRPSPCSPVLPPDTVNARFRAVDAQLRRREDAVVALMGAYQALQREAETDDAAALEAATAKASNAASAFAVSVGLPALPALAIEIGRAGAAYYASSAERQRLLRASTQIRAATQLVAASQDRLRVIVARERTEYLNIRQEVRDKVVERGLALEDADLSAAISAAGLKADREAKRRGERPVRAAAAAYGELDRRRSFEAAMASFDASTRALLALDARHGEFESGAPLRTADLIAQMNDLTARIRRARGLDEETKP